MIGEYLATDRRGSAETNSKPLTINPLMLAYWKHVKSYHRKNGKPTSELPAVKTVLGPIRRLDGGGPAGEFGPLATFDQERNSTECNDRYWRRWIANCKLQKEQCEV